jgi:hypothetical protein
MNTTKEILESQQKSNALVKPTASAATQESQLTLTDPKAIAMYEQLRMMISNGKRLTNYEAMVLANFAHVEGLDPLAGECYLLKGKDEKVAGCMVGINGLRRKAKEKLAESGADASYWVDIKKADLPNEEYEYAYVATLRDTVTIKKYLELYEQADKIVAAQTTTSEGHVPSMDYRARAVREIIGEMPLVLGYGYFRKDERNQYTDKKFSPMDRAMKRAEAAAIKQRFSLNYKTADIQNGIVMQQDQIEDGVADGVDSVVSVVIDVPAEPEQPAQIAQPAKQEETKIYSTQKVEWNKSYYDVLINNGLAKNDFNAKAMLALCNLKPNSTVNEVLKWGEIYREFRKTLDSKGAADAANRGMGLN